MTEEHPSKQGVNRMASTTRVVTAIVSTRDAVSYLIPLRACLLEPGLRGYPQPSLPGNIPSESGNLKVLRPYFPTGGHKGLFFAPKHLRSPQQTGSDRRSR